MKRSLKIMVLLGIVQCIVLTLGLMLYFRYQRSLEREATVPTMPVDQPSEQ